MNRGEGARLLAVLLGFALFYILVLMRLFGTREDYTYQPEKDEELRCTARMRHVIDQNSACQGRLVALEEEKKQLEVKNAQLSTLLHRDVVAKEAVVVVAAVVIMACNRADYLDRTVRSVLRYHSKVALKFPLFISQDGGDQGVRDKASSFSEIKYMQHLDLQPPEAGRGEMVAYYKIARHYKWALTQLFDVHKFGKVIILEDDMEIAPDFFDYFEATAWLLETDSSLIAVSSWNDNGQRQFVQDPEAVYRADFFPGLGWMMSKRVWEELSPQWPKAYWDDWLRQGEVRKGRQVIRPEICRTYNFGEHGSSQGQFFSQFLRPIKVNDVQVDWKSKDLTFLLRDEYVKYFARLVEDAVPVSSISEASQADRDVRMEYRSQAHFEELASQFGVFQEWKDGVPRTAYLGVVVFRWRTDTRVFLTAPDSLQKLGITPPS